MLVDNDKFLTRMAKAFEDSKTVKSIRAAEEAVEKVAGDTVMETDDKDKEYATVVRLASGTKTKFSTLVQPHDLERFMVQYTNIIKINMDALKKKERKKAPKAKKATA
ncbi:hypothetical protein BGZ76_008052 [Entomortierella beljakovae]|nr:hypothetical protein BGZ76_008052 [Entomortierella beljakovae]